MVLKKNGVVYWSSETNGIGAFLQLIPTRDNPVRIVNADSVPIWPRHSVTLKGNDIRLGYYSLEITDTGLGPSFNVQEVCIDQAGLATLDDPIACARKRKLRIGEPLPYVRHDRAHNQFYLINNNVPHLKRLSLQVVSGREFGVNSADSANYRAFFDFDATDGYDIIEPNGNFSSIVGTRDPVTTDARFFWWSQDCRKEDGWLLFGNSLQPNNNGTEIAKLRGGTTCNPSSGYSSARTIWNWYQNEPRVYTNGKKAESIVSWHFGGVDGQGDMKHIEVFYMNRAYGMSRWERWETAAGCVKTAEAAGQNPSTFCDIPKRLEANRISASCNGADTETHFGETFYRFDCRDWTYTMPLEVPLHPYHTPLSLDFVSSRNLLRTHDFASSKIDGWNRLGTPNTTNWAHVADPKTKNVSLAMSCAGPCQLNSIYQDVDPNPIVADYARGNLRVQAGATLKGPVGKTGMLSIHLINPQGNLIETKSVKVLFTNRKSQPAAFNFPWNFSASPVGFIRYEFYLEGEGQYVIDDTFLALLP